MDKYINQADNVDLLFLNKELNWICEKLKCNIERYQDKFPSACTTEHKYRIKENDDWTNGFWTGMLWLAYLHTKDEVFLNTVKKNINSFNKRLEDHFVLDHHDIGFLYSPSIVSVYNETKDKHLETIIMQAADKLIARFQEKGQFIQAWGSLGEEKEYRLIIDSLLNLPLLYKASELSGHEIYKIKADQHYHQVINNIIREDYSTYHTFYFDTKTGMPSHGATHQGFNDQSCWARGQAWAILGMPIHGNKEDKELFLKVFNYFMNKIPSDGVPYWDLCFDETSNEPRDSSALAIVACGMVEAQKVGYLDNGEQLAKGMIYDLSKGYTSENKKEYEGLLLHGVYAYSENKGVDEENLWGDYYYMECLYRLLNKEWKTCW